MGEFAGAATVVFVIAFIGIGIPWLKREYSEIDETHGWRKSDFLRKGEAPRQSCPAASRAHPSVGRRANGSQHGEKRAGGLPHGDAAKRPTLSHVKKREPIFDWENDEWLSLDDVQ